MRSRLQEAGPDVRIDVGICDGAGMFVCRVLDVIVTTTYNRGGTWGPGGFVTLGFHPVFVQSPPDATAAPGRQASTRKPELLKYKTWQHTSKFRASEQCRRRKARKRSHSSTTHGRKTGHLTDTGQAARLLADTQSQIAQGKLYLSTSDRQAKAQSSPAITQWTMQWADKQTSQQTRSRTCNRLDT